jgi:hypothetical protein
VNSLLLHIFPPSWCFASPGAQNQQSQARTVDWGFWNYEPKSPSLRLFLSGTLWLWVSN